MLIRQVRHELFKLFARRRTYIGFIAFLAVQLVVLALLQHPKANDMVREMMLANGLAFHEYYRGLTTALLSIVFTFTFLGVLYIALVAGDIVAKEVEDGQMRLILARPISRSRLLAIKAFACSLYTVLLVGFLAVTALVVCSLYYGGLGKLFLFVPDEDLFVFYDTGEGLFRFVRAVACIGYSSLLLAAVAFMFSCFNMKPAAATVLTLSLFFIDVVLQHMPYFEQLRYLFVSYHFAWWVRTLHDPVPWAKLAVSVALLSALMATCYTIGVARFCTRDLKS